MKRIFVFALAVACAAALAQGPGPGAQGGPGQGRGGNRMGMQMGMQRGGGLQLINRPDVQKELVITDAQKTQIAELFPQRARGGGGPGAGAPAGGPAAGPRGGGGQGGPAGGPQGGPAAGPRGGQGGPGGDPAQMQARQAEQEKKLQAILTPTQWTRFSELRLQNEGANALMREDVATKLGLTQDQKNKLQEIQRTSMEAMRDAMQGAREGGEFNREEMQAMMEKHRKDTEAKMLAVLTEAQRTQWTAMLGKPFKFDQIGR